MAIHDHLNKQSVYSRGSRASAQFSLAGHTHFQGEWVWVLWTAFRASLRNVRGSNLIGPFLTRHMTSCMLAVYIVLLSFLRTQRKVMMAARSRLSDFLRLLLAALSFLSLPVYQSNCSKQLLSILVEEKLIQHRDTLGSPSHSTYV